MTRGTFPRLVHGVVAPAPLRGFPAGRIRLRLRNTEFAQAFVRTPDRGIRRFYVAETEDNFWEPAYEIGANVTAENRQ